MPAISPEQLTKTSVANRQLVIHRVIAASAIGFFLFILWIIYLANSGSSSPFFSFVHAIPFGDKLGHFGLFGTLTLISILATRYRTFQLGFLNIYYAAAGVAVFVVCEEISQLLLPLRTFDPVDLSADFLGILVATGLMSLMNKQIVSTN